LRRFRGAGFSDKTGLPDNPVIVREANMNVRIMMTGRQPVTFFGSVRVSGAPAEYRMLVESHNKNPIH